MALNNSATAYGQVSKTLHWLIALLLIIMLIGGFFMDDIVNKAVKDVITNLHKLTGIAILGLMIVRLVWRLCTPRPNLLVATPKWQQVAANGVHALLYTLVILMPLSGWIMSSAANHAPHLGALALPLPFITVSKAMSALFFDYHHTLAWVIIGLLTVHILAALKHQFIDKDQVLKGMLP